MSADVKCFLDEPSLARIDGPEVRLRGWIAARAGQLERLALRSVHASVRVVPHPRPDVSSVYGDHDVVGFSATIRLAEHLPAVTDSALIVYVLCGSRVAGGFRFEVAKGALSRALESAVGD